MALLQSRAQQLSTPIPSEVLELICHKARPSIRELEGCLNRVVASARLMGKAITIDEAYSCLSRAGEPACAQPAITPEDILALVAEHFQIAPETLTSRLRGPQITQARQIAIFLIREEAQYSLMEIGHFLGHRDHSTIIYNYKRVARLVETSPHMKEIVNTLRESLHTKSKS